jgi:hypothetical protein
MEPRVGFLLLIFLAICLSVLLVRDARKEDEPDADDFD